MNREEQLRQSYDRLWETHRLTLIELRDAKAERYIEKPVARKAKKGAKSPKLRGTKATVAAAVVWMVLSKTGWLEKIIEPIFFLPPGFFVDAEIAGYCTLGLAWAIRESREMMEIRNG